MGRPERPLDPAGNAVQRLASQLRALRAGAGRPSYRRMAGRVHYSAGTLAQAARGDRMPSLGVTLAYVRACGGDEAHWRSLWSSADEAHSAEGGRAERHPPPANVCPYLGFHAFQPEHAGQFFGRAHLVERILALLDRRRVVAVVGASGSGKSSLLRAGVIGAVRSRPDLARRWQVALMTPTGSPTQALVAQFARITGIDALRLGRRLADEPDAAGLEVRTALASAPPHTRVLLVVDQFEELFTLCHDEADRHAFMALLLQVAAGGDHRITVLLGVPAAFITPVTCLPGMAAAIGEDGSIHVGPPTPNELWHMVARPPERAGVSVTDDLVVTAVADAAREPGGLAFLSCALRETWLRREDGRLDLGMYLATGGVRGAVVRAAEATYAGLDGEQRRVARQIMFRLCTWVDGFVDPGGRIAREDLNGIAAASTIAEVLDRLSRARLIVLNETTVQAAHEALLRCWPRLHRWISDGRVNLAAHRLLAAAARNWQELDRDSVGLLRGAPLSAAHAWADKHPMEVNELEAALLTASDEFEREDLRAARWRTRIFNRLLSALAARPVAAQRSRAQVRDHRL